MVDFKRMNKEGKITILNKKFVDPEIHKEKDTYYVARPTALGNPFSHLARAKQLGLEKTATVEEAVEKYHQWLRKEYMSNKKVKELIDALVAVYIDGAKINLVCFCAPQKGLKVHNKPWICHAQVIAYAVIKLTEQQEAQQQDSSQ